MCSLSELDAKCDCATISTRSIIDFADLMARSLAPREKLFT